MTDTNPLNSIASIVRMDPSGMAKAANGNASADELKSATQEFEALFLGYLLKVMRSTVDPAEPESSLGKDIYLELFDNEIALNIARTRGLGIGDMIYRQLAEENSADIPVKPAAPLRVSPEPATPALPDDEAPQQHSSRVTPSYPVSGRLTSRYGPRTDPFTGRLRLHRGIDIAAPAGTPFHAASPGTVVFAGLLSDYGNTVIVEDPDGNRTLYGHAARVLVRAGDTVDAQQPLGFVGSTGRSTGPHLHFEAQVGNQPVDPEILIESALSSKNPDISLKYPATVNDKQGNQE
jgi:murein DD-endopeptidase MepM/ murein hydrolase activator NlpD